MKDYIELWRIAAPLIRISDDFKRLVDHWIKINPTPEERQTALEAWGKETLNKIREYEEKKKENLKDYESLKCPKCNTFFRDIDGFNGLIVTV